MPSATIKAIVPERPEKPTTPTLGTRHAKPPIATASTKPAKTRESPVTKLSQPVTTDTTAVVCMSTPAGLIAILDRDKLPDGVRAALDEEDDAQAARAMFNHTGLMCTVRRTSQTTCNEKQ